MDTVFCGVQYGILPEKNQGLPLAANKLIGDL